MDKKIKKCPYCSEDIQAEAKKCKHCGEWLREHELMPRFKGSSDARAVTKGIKEKEADQSCMTFIVLIILIISIVVWVYSFWLIGVLVFFALSIPAGIWYMKE